MLWTSAAWAFVALRSARRQLGRRGLNELTVPAPPPLPGYGRRGVVSVLSRSRATCLVEAVVLQRWDAAHGRRRDLVVGVTAPSAGFKALRGSGGDPPCHHAPFSELVRRSASA